MLTLQLRPILFDPVDCSPPGSSIHGILQERILEWVATSFSRGSSWPMERTRVSCIAGRLFPNWATREDSRHFKISLIRTFLVVQRLVISLPMQGTQVWFLVWEESTCKEATKPTHLEPMLWSKRSHLNEKTSHHNEEQPLEKACVQQWTPSTAANK